jgi:hypothetical protein
MSVTRSGTMKAFRWLQLGTILLVGIVVGLVLLSGLGTLLSTSVSQPAISTVGTTVTLTLSYRALDPGPFSADPIVVSVSLLDANGSVVLSSPPQSYRVGAFASASGNFTFTLDFSQMSPTMFNAFRDSTAPLTLKVGISSGLGGLVHIEVTSNLTVSGVE